YGLFFPVGDTTGAPGLVRGLRSASINANYARAIAEHCPAAWVINYSNPMSICTRTLTYVAPELKVVGCCHEVFGTQKLLAELAQEYLQLDAAPPRDEIRVNVLGINHFTWIDRADYRGTDLLALVREHIQKPGVLRPYTRAEVTAKQNYFVDHHQVKFTLFKYYGILAAAGDRHLCEFMPGFTRSEEELFRWGLIRTPISYRIAERDRGDIAVYEYIEGRRAWVLRQSNEEVVRQLRALSGLGSLVTNVNMKNMGQVSNLPQDSVVETNALLSRGEVRPLTADALPRPVASLVSTHIANQEMIIQAALTRDPELAFQAVFNDPTTNLPIDRAWAMFQEMFVPSDIEGAPDML
ncbi:MAG TPA: alpha-glucosidase/alpha-galactosidase, partial [Anaerolineae bacterium]|nr:alpha-glucosidase/alpha-galactosidase [Anaerolineae bacterium]